VKRWARFRGLVWIGLADSNRSDGRASVSPRSLRLVLHHAPADHRRVAVAITAGYRLLKHLLLQLAQRAQ
jgi:hypothetical protein